MKSQDFVIGICKLEYNDNSNVIWFICLFYFKYCSWVIF